MLLRGLGLKVTLPCCPEDEPQPPKVHKTSDYHEFLRHTTTTKCHVGQDLFLVDIVSFEFEKVSNRQHTSFPHQLTVFTACLIAVISTLVHSVCVSKFLMWLM